MKKTKNKTEKLLNYKFVGALSKMLHPILNILFYISVFLTLLLLILSAILFFVNTSVEDMLLPPFMHKVEQADDSETEAYTIFLGNGVKIVTAAENVTLANIKTVLFSGINVLIFTLLTVAPIFKFLAALLDNINKKIYLDIKNARYIMFTGLCVSIGTVIIRFMTQFYNYYLLTKFITDTSQDISLQLRVDVLSGITGLIIIFTGLVLAYICQDNILSDAANDGRNREEAEKTTDIVIKQ